MKKFLTTTALLIFAACTTIVAQTRQDEYLGLPGDNLNLYAVMKLFQGSETLESFERNLNDENSRINNLDLNGDNLIDYIRVIDYINSDVHTIVLRVAINKREDQDIAVFTVQRFRNGQVQIQLIGDEALYGRNYIIEPIYAEQYANETSNPGYTGNVSVATTTYYEVGAWPVIRFIYMPDYVVWHSAWYWGYYPTYWHAWRPYYWDFYYGYHYNWYNDYYTHFHHCDYYRYNHWDDFYYSNRRSHSHYVSERIETGHYKDTYSHPEQRRHGEELYARTNNDQINRRSDPTFRNTTARSSDTRTNQNRHTEGTSFSTSRRTGTTATRTASTPTTGQKTTSARRTATTTNERITAKPATDQNTSFARRSNTTVNERLTVKPAAKHNTGTTVRSTATMNDRVAANPVKENNTFAARRSNTAVSDKQAVNRNPVQSAAKSRPTSKPATSGESFSSRRSSGQSQSVKSHDSGEKQKSAEPAKTAHRR